MNIFQELIKVGDIHVKRINLAMDAMKKIFPLSPENIENFTTEELLYTELLISRFAKLQDFIGKTFINSFLQLTGDYQDSMTMIDKIHLLEKLNIIQYGLWKKIRDIRNHISHEYPDHPEIICVYLNQIFEISPNLINLFETIKKRGSELC